MKKYILFLLLFISASATAQSIFTAGITYCAGPPVHNPGNTGSRFAIDTVTFDLYTRSTGTSWEKTGDRLREIVGCVPPATPPTKYQSPFVINACDSLYWYNGSTWGHLNPVPSEVKSGEYKWKAAATGIATDPGDGYVAVNAATPSTAGYVVISKLTDGGYDVSALFNQLREGDALRIQQGDDNANWIRYDVDSAALLIGTTHYSIKVTPAAAQGTEPGNNESVIVSLFLGGGGAGSSGITGTGLANRVPVWTDAGNLSYESTFRMDTTNNRLILGSQTVTPARTLHVEGEARVSDLTTDTPTRLVGADADGDLGQVTVGSGLSLSGGTLSNPNTGTVTGAENGTSIVSNKVRLGGPLLTTTSIEGNGFDLRFFDGKVSFSSWTGFANTPTQFMQIQALEALPTLLTTPTYDGVLELRAHNSSGSDQPNTLTFGVYPTDADGVWMQARSRSTPSFEYPLSMQPRGGQASIGRVTGLAAHFTVTASALTGSTASGSVLLLENPEGNAKTSMALGSGSNNVNGEVAMFHTADALRLTNRLANNGTSSVRIAIGSETSDVATFEKSAAATLVQFGVGTTAPHSTLQSAGSLATAYLETVGAPTFDETKRTVVYTASTNISWTIPTAAGCACTGREYILHHTGTAGTITLSNSVSKGNGTTFNTLARGEWAYIIYGSATIRGYKLTSL